MRQVGRLSPSILESIRIWAAGTGNSGCWDRKFGLSGDSTGDKIWGKLGLAPSPPSNDAWKVRLWNLTAPSDSKVFSFHDMVGHMCVLELPWHGPLCQNRTTKYNTGIIKCRGRNQEVITLSGCLLYEHFLSCFFPV